MRDTIIAASLILAAPAVAAAQPAGRGAPTTPPAISTLPPKVFLDAGYSHPDITPGMCEAVSAKEVKCTIPEMTAGPYIIEAAGTSTAQSADAVQAIAITISGAPCNQARSNNAAKGSKPWSSGPQTIRVACVIEVLTDRPLVVTASYADKAATSDPKGPSLSLRRAPWPGILQAGPAGAEADQPKAQ